MKKIILWICIICILVLVITTLLWSMFFKEYSIKNVFKIPEGFILLDDVIYPMTDVNCVCWESQISFTDPSGITLYQTSVSNSNFIVKYRGKCYINEDEYIKFTTSGVNTD